MVQQLLTIFPAVSSMVNHCLSHRKAYCTRINNEVSATNDDDNNNNHNPCDVDGSSIFNTGPMAFR